MILDISVAHSLHLVLFLYLGGLWWGMAKRRFTQIGQTHLGLNLKPLRKSELPAETDQISNSGRD